MLTARQLRSSHSTHTNQLSTSLLHSTSSINFPKLLSITLKTHIIMHGKGGQVKVHYKGENDDFLVFVDSAQSVRDWKADKSVPLAQVVNGWKIFVTHK